MGDVVEFELMRPPQIVEARRRCPLVYLPIGPLEWHGPHLPLGTDGLHAHRVAVEVARRVGGVVLPTYFLGTDTVRPAEGAQSVRALGFDGDERIVGMDFPDNPVKSVYIEEGAFAVIIREIVNRIKQDSYRFVVIVNGHGAPITCGPCAGWPRRNQILLGCVSCTRPRPALPLLRLTLDTPNGAKPRSS